MSAIAQAKAMYAKHGLDFEADLAAYLQHGYVFTTPDWFIMARPIDTASGLEWLQDWGKANAWYVKMAAGKGGLSWFMSLMPFPLPFLAWQRGFKGDEHLRVFRTDKVISKLL